MKRNFLLLIAALFCTAQAFAWGQKGHDVTAFIAENHLTDNAKSKIVAALDGHSLVYYANWLDNASNTQEYRYTKTWHYKNVDADETYENAQLATTGDVVVALKDIVAKLKNGNLSHEDENIALRMIIHLVGDMHQPLHMGHRSDRGGNQVQITSFNRNTNLHSYWDSEIVEFVHKWSYSEWQYQIDRASAEEEAKIVAGRLRHMGKGVREHCTRHLCRHSRRHPRILRLRCKIRSHRGTAVAQRRPPLSPPAQRNLQISPLFC